MTLLVTGGAGQLGSRVIELLLESGASVATTTRRPGSLAALAARGVHVRRADFGEPASLRDAFAGVDRLLLVSTDVLLPGARFAHHRAAIEAARAAGVRHVVYTSLSHPVEGSPVLLHDDHRRTEDALAASGMDFTALRNDLYADFLPGTLAEAARTGELVGAAGEGGAAYVTREDCARAAAAALRNERGSRALEITGPEVLTHDDLARLASELSGRPVAYRDVGEAALRERFVASGLDPVAAAIFASYGPGIARGLFGPASSAVRELTSREPEAASAFVRRVGLPS